VIRGLDDLSASAATNPSIEALLSGAARLIEAVNPPGNAWRSCPITSPATPSVGRMQLRPVAHSAPTCYERILSRPGRSGGQARVPARLRVEAPSGRAENGSDHLGIEVPVSDQGSRQRSSRRRVEFTLEHKG
jgi:hypothetical protein